ncbi:hypothetical protein TIFTF001_030197 [Ficus carica]|uniref:Uncharacterized protein n=1 Tax=Ficus carica TaxID=3494 RepID=A0AA88DTQ0_FICCA|nr:hypothetical protein TIFTF001_030197 [Ficus carica]
MQIPLRKKVNHSIPPEVMKNQKVAKRRMRIIVATPPGSPNETSVETDGLYYSDLECNSGDEEHSEDDIERAYQKMYSKWIQLCKLNKKLEDRVAELVKEKDTLKRDIDYELEPTLLYITMFKLDFSPALIMTLHGYSSHLLLKVGSRFAFGLLPFTSLVDERARERERETYQVHNRGYGRLRSGVVGRGWVSRKRLEGGVTAASRGKRERERPEKELVVESRPAELKGDGEKERLRENGSEVGEKMEGGVTVE